MSTTWQSYAVGTAITIDGKNWMIREISKRPTKKGRETRVFTLSNEDGRVVRKTSRGLTKWANRSSTPVESRVEAPPAALTWAGVELPPHVGGEGNDTLLEIIANAVQARVDASKPVMDKDEIARIVDERMPKGVDRDEVARIVAEGIAKASLPRRVEVVQIDGSKRDVGVQHTHFDALLRVVACRINAWLVGPAGSGKTSAGKAVADALGLKFYAKSVGPQTTESSLLGYKNVTTGEFVTTQLREAYENGGVFLLDEVDAGNPAVLVVINSLLANGHTAFPDAVVEKHPDFVLLAGANTIGQGADRQYVGRQQIDAATLDRFAFMGWECDPAIEAAATGVPFHCFDGLPRPKARVFHDGKNADGLCEEFVKKTTKIRLAIMRLGDGVRMIVGHRANESGCKLIRAGWSVEDVLDACVWKGCPRDTRAKVEANVK